MSDSTQPESQDGSSQRRTIRWLLVAALLHGLAYLLLLPPWMGEDEPWHMEYVHHIAAGHEPWGGDEASRADLVEFSPSQALLRRELGGLSAEEVRGTQRAIVDSMAEHAFYERVDWASWGGGVENFDQVSPYFTATHQPPLYYLVTGKLVGLVTNGDVLVELWLERLISLCAYLAVVLAAYQVGRRVSSEESIAIACALLVAWLPMHARQAGVVNNDVLAKVASSWALVFGLDLALRGSSWRLALQVFGLVAIGLALKTTAAGVLAPIGLALLWRSSRVERLQQKPVRIAGAVGLALLVGVMFVAYRFSNNPAIPETFDNLTSRLSAAWQPEFRHEFFRTAVGAFNWYSRDLPGWLHSSVAWALAASCLGLAIGFAKPRPDFHRGLAFLCLTGCLLQLSLVVMRGTAAGRYVMPMLPAFAILIVCGWLVPLPARWRERATILMALALIAYDGYFAWAGLVWNQYGVWGS